MKNKLKFLPVLLAVLLFSVKGFAQNKPAKKPVTQIYFIEDNWKLALSQAAAQNKYIFVDAYATWCGPCKMMKERTFTDSKVASFYNKNFINISIDMEKGLGPQLARDWQMEAYPTLIIFSPKGKPVLGSVGFIEPNAMMQLAQQALAKKI